MCGRYRFTDDFEALVKCFAGLLIKRGEIVPRWNVAPTQLAPVVVQQVFELVRRIRQSGLTVLIVEQNVQQVLKVVDRAYLLEAGSIRASGTSAELQSSDTIKQAYLGV